MSLNRLVSAISIALGSVAAVSSAAGSVPSRATQSDSTPALYIVQGDSLNTADKSVVRVNAKVEQEFEIIHSVSAYLTPEQVSALRGTPGLRVYADRKVSERGVVGNAVAAANASVNAINNAASSSVVAAANASVSAINN